MGPIKRGHPVESSRMPGPVPRPGGVVHPVDRPAIPRPPGPPPTRARSTSHRFSTAAIINSRSNSTRRRAPVGHETPTEIGKNQRDRQLWSYGSPMARLPATRVLNRATAQSDTGTSSAQSPSTVRFVRTSYTPSSATSHRRMRWTGTRRACPALTSREDARPIDAGKPEAREGAVPAPAITTVTSSRAVALEGIETRPRNPSCRWMWFPALRSLALRSRVSADSF